MMHWGMKRGAAASLLSASQANAKDAHPSGGGTRLISHAVVAGLRTGRIVPDGGLSARQFTELREALTRAASDVGMSATELSDALERAR